MGMHLRRTLIALVLLSGLFVAVHVARVGWIATDRGATAPEQEGNLRNDVQAAPAPAGESPDVHPSGETRADPHTGSSQDGLTKQDGARDDLGLDGMLMALAACAGGRVEARGLPSTLRHELLGALLELDEHNDCQQAMIRSLVDFEALTALDDHDLGVAVRILGAGLLDALQISDPSTRDQLDFLIRVLDTALDDPDVARLVTPVVFRHTSSLSALNALIRFSGRVDPSSTLDAQSLRQSAACTFASTGIWRCTDPDPEWYDAALAAIEQDSSRSVQTVGFLAMRMLARFNGDPRAMACLMETLDSSIREAEVLDEPSPLTTNRLSEAMIALEEIQPDPYTIRRLEGLYRKADPTIRGAAIEGAWHLILHLPEEDRAPRVAQIRYVAESESDPTLFGLEISALKRIDPDWLAFVEELQARPLAPGCRRTVDEVLRKARERQQDR